MAENRGQRSFRHPDPDPEKISGNVGISRSRGIAIFRDFGHPTQNGVMLWDTLMTYAYDTSGRFQPQEVLKEEVTREVMAETRQQLDLMEQ